MFTPTTSIQQFSGEISHTKEDKEKQQKSQGLEIREVKLL